MSWVLIFIAVWVAVALAVAVVIGRSIHLADLKRQANLDRLLYFGEPGTARSAGSHPSVPLVDERNLVWRDTTAGGLPRAERPPLEGERRGA
jgi:hypothetical protein